MPLYIQIFTQTKPTVLIPFQFRVHFWINLISGDSIFICHDQTLLALYVPPFVTARYNEST